MMIDVTTPKVAIPTVLFAVFQLAPLPLDPIQKALASGILLYAIFSTVITRTFTKADILAHVLLSIVLTPGVLVTLPPGASFQEAVAVHSIVFAILFAALRYSLAVYF